jgi:hypothetical protein
MKVNEERLTDEKHEENTTEKSYKNQIEDFKYFEKNAHDSVRTIEGNKFRLQGGRQVFALSSKSGQSRNCEIKSL